MASKFKLYGSHHVTDILLLFKDINKDPIVYLVYFKIKTMKKLNQEYISKEEVNEMIESALRRHNRRSTIISSVLGWILIGGYSFGLFQAVQNV